MSLINISKLSVTDTVCFLFTNQSRLSSEAVSKNISLTDTSVCAVTNTYHQPHIELRTQTRARSLTEFCLVYNDTTMITSQCRNMSMAHAENSNGNMKMR